MDLRQLGRTGLQVSPLGLGTTKFGRTQQVKYPNAFELPEDGRVRDLFKAAAQCGVNLIDTAPAYGSSEQRIGALLPEPERWVIVTKAGETFSDGRSQFDFSPTAIAASIDGSRRRLQREVLDVVLLHCDDDDSPVLRDSGAIDALAEQKIKGRIRAFGASVKSVNGGLLAAATCDVVMVTLTPDYRTMVPVIKAAASTGCGVLIKKALDSGHQTDPVAALAEVVREPGVASVIVGTIDPAHLAGNCAAVEHALAGAGAAAGF